MRVIGRLTADAVVRTTTTDKKVVGFSLAENDTYMSNGELNTVTRFYECSYWNNQEIAPYLKKGMVVELRGELGVRAYLSDGEAKANLTLRVLKVVLFGSGHSEGHEATAEATAVPADDTDIPPVTVNGDLTF